MKDRHAGLSPGHPGGTAPAVLSYSWVTAGETATHHRVACPQAGQGQVRQMNTLQVPELTKSQTHLAVPACLQNQVSCICKGAGPVSFQPSSKKLSLRYKNFTPKTMPWHGMPVAQRALPAGELFKGKPIYFELKQHLQEQLSINNNLLRIVLQLCYSVISYRAPLSPLLLLLSWKRRDNQLPAALLQNMLLSWMCTKALTPTISSWSSLDGFLN